MASDRTVVNGGIGPLGLLGVALVVGKLAGWFEISWFWATAPFWGGFLLFFFIFIVAFIVLVVKD